MEVFYQLLERQKELMTEVPHRHEIPDRIQGSVLSGLGVIEETMEYLNSIGYKAWRPSPLPRERQLEELVDILHFVLELIIYSGFTLEEIVAAYWEKSSINLDRWRRAKAGDYSWDKRAEQPGL